MADPRETRKNLTEPMPVYEDNEKVRETINERGLTFLMRLNRLTFELMARPGLKQSVFDIFNDLRESYGLPILIILENDKRIGELPAGTKKMIDAFTGKEISEGNHRPEQVDGFIIMRIVAGVDKPEPSRIE